MGLWSDPVKNFVLSAYTALSQGSPKRNTCIGFYAHPEPCVSRPNSDISCSFKTVEDYYSLVRLCIQERVYCSHFNHCQEGSISSPFTAAPGRFLMYCRAPYSFLSLVTTSLQINGWLLFGKCFVRLDLIA